MLIALACTEDPGDSTGSEVQISDSAGITVVDVGRLGGIDAPAWDADRVYSTAQSDVEFFRVGAARILPEGRVVVGDDGNKQLVVLDRNGRAGNRIGREGEGPGEFGRITSIHPTGGGFWVYDTGMGRWSRFDESGEFETSEPMPPPNRIVDLRPLAFEPGGGVLAVYGEMRYFAGQGIQRDTTPVLRYAGVDADPDTLGMLAASEWAYSSNDGRGWFRTYVGFARSMVAFGRDSLAVLGDTDSLNVSLLDVRGRERLRIRGGGSRIPTSPQDGERWRESIFDRMSPSAPDRAREIYREAPFHDSYPAFDGAAVDAAGRIWVGETTELGAEERLWVIFGSDGMPVGRVALPADGEILDIGEDRVLLLLTDELEVQDVAMYALDPAE